MQKHSYDLCLTDMRLPDGEGLELLEPCQPALCDTPVAVITAHGSAENAVAALKAGAFDYLAKPVVAEQLRALVRSALKLPRASTQRKARRQRAGYRIIPVARESRSWSRRAR